MSEVCSIWRQKEGASQELEMRKHIAFGALDGALA